MAEKNERWQRKKNMAEKKEHGGKKIRWQGKKGGGGEKKMVGEVAYQSTILQR